LIVKSRRNASSSGEGIVVMDELLAFGRGGIGCGHTVRDDFFARRHLTPERRDLDHFLAELDMRQPEAAADDPAVSKKLLDLIRMCRGADVEVFGPPSQNQIAHAAAHEIGDVVVLTQTVEHLQSIRIDVLAGNRVFLARHDPRHDHRPHCTKSVTKAM
jgi:hypothetical protein